MPTTSNFGWTTPADTDLVKDGAAAIRTLGNGIDNSFLDLKGGTTGQILSKASNTDLDYTWINNDVGDITAVTAGTGISGGGTTGAVTITNDMATTITAAGDIVVGTGSSTYDNLPIGTTGQVLTADTTVSPYKVKWANAGSAFVGCRLYLGSNLSINDATDTVVTWNSETFDTDAFHSTSSNTSRITIPAGKDGKYSISAQFMMGMSDTKQLIIYLYKNGSLIGRSQNCGAVTSNNLSVAFNDVYNLSAADYLEVYIFQNNGTATNLLATLSTAEVSWFGVTYLGA